MHTPLFLCTQWKALGFACNFLCRNCQVTSVSRLADVHQVGSGRGCMVTIILMQIAYNRQAPLLMCAIILQGALLMTFLEKPLYMSSLVVLFNVPFSAGIMTSHMDKHSSSSSQQTKQGEIRSALYRAVAGESKAGCPSPVCSVNMLDH